MDKSAKEKIEELKLLKLSINFSASEFACPCCGEAKIKGALIKALEQLRKEIGDKPITVTSGYRCKEYNEKIGGAPNSAHVRGLAADIACSSVPLRTLFYKAESIPHFKDAGVGLYPDNNFVHVDVYRGGPKRWGRTRAAGYTSLEAAFARLDEIEKNQPKKKGAKP